MPWRARGLVSDANAGMTGAELSQLTALAAETAAKIAEVVARLDGW
jgi:hypothetical protein